MVSVQSTEVTKKLLLRFIQENIEFRKRSVYLHEIIAMSRKNDIWRKALIAFFDTPYYSSDKSFSKN